MVRPVRRRVPAAVSRWRAIDPTAATSTAMAASAPSTLTAPVTPSAHGSVMRSSPPQPHGAAFHDLGPPPGDPCQCAAHGRAAPRRQQTGQAGHGGGPDHRGHDQVGGHGHQRDGGLHQNLHRQRAALRRNGQGHRLRHDRGQEPFQSCRAIAPVQVMMPNTAAQESANP